MTINGILQILVFFIVLLVLTKPVGVYMAKAFSGELTWLRPLERAFYRLMGVREDEENALERLRFCASCL